jgi:hypothetical protein
MRRLILKIEEPHLNHIPKVRSFFLFENTKKNIFFHFSLVGKLDCHDMISFFFVANGRW